jgi:hypothetical protein
MASGKVTAKVDLSALKRLISRPQEVLQALDGAVHGEARRTLDFSAFLVPVGDPGDDSNLAATGFLSGPIYNEEVLSTTFLCGYSHHAAGAIHEGFHWGKETETPRPRWMRHALRGSKSRAKKAVAATLATALRRFFPAQ